MTSKSVKLSSLPACQLARLTLYTLNAKKCQPRCKPRNYWVCARFTTSKSRKNREKCQVAMLGNAKVFREKVSSVSTCDIKIY